MKITRENFHEVEGRKIREAGMEKTSSFSPYFLTTTNVMHGKDELGYHCAYDLEDETLNWEFYREAPEPKKPTVAKQRVKLYPAIAKNLVYDKHPWITSRLYGSEEDAVKDLQGSYLAWPVESICVEVEE